MNKSYLSLLTVAVVSLVFTVSTGYALQPPTTETIQSPSTSPFAQSNNRTISRSLARTYRNQDPLAQAMKDLKEAEDNDAKDTALDTIRGELEQQYDAFLKSNEEQIEELQTRLDNLREQLVRRRDAKSKMVELEMERVLNESEGLVWPNNGRRNARGFSNFYSPSSNIQTQWGNRAVFPERLPNSQSQQTTNAVAPRLKSSGSSRPRNSR